MKIFTSGQVRKIDAYTIENEPIASIDLMERASVQITSWLAEMFDNSHPFIISDRTGEQRGRWTCSCPNVAGEKIPCRDPADTDIRTAIC